MGWLERNGVRTLWVLAFAALLFAHGRVFDFICDDSYITFRYAKNFVEHGAPIYNLSERVEGYTNFLWMLGVAAAFRVGLDVQQAVLALGALATLVLGAGIAVGFASSSVKRVIVWTLVAVGIASSASLAAWTLSGLETGMYAALVALGAGLLARTAARLQRGDAIAMGVVFALAMLTRPEGVVPMGIAVMVLLALRRTAALRSVLLACVAFGVLVIPFVAWRWSYYGDPLPNTFYLKTGGDASALREHGLRYVWLGIKDYHWTIVPLALMAFVPIAPQSLLLDIESERSRKALAWFSRAVIVLLVPYVISVGGDFLGLFRFLVPFVPLLWILFGLALDALCSFGKSSPARFAAPVLATAFIAGYAQNQLDLGAFVRSETDPEQQQSGLEPIHWTRLYALRWAAMGRWIAERAEPEDWMAVGAAGAMPYYAGISNLDVLGLCDRFVAREGIIVGSRPGHQRRAPQSYTLSKHPVFLFEGDYDSDAQQSPRRDAGWRSRGYTWVEAHVRADKHLAPSDYYFYFLMRSDRAEALRARGDEDLRVAE